MSDPDDKQGKEPDWVEFDEAWLWTSENPMIDPALWDRAVGSGWVTPPADLRPYIERVNEVTKDLTGHDRWFTVPKIENVSAPTVSEIQAAMADDDNVLPVGSWSITPPDLTYVYEPPEPFFEEGVTTGTLVLWDGTPGPAQRMDVTVLADADGNAWVEPTGEWQDTTVVDDREDPDA